MNRNLLHKILGSALLLLNLALTATSQAATPSLVPPTETYAGKTHAQWVESWWKWIFNIPGTATEFPFLDSTGANSGVNQSGPVFFLSKSWLGKKGNPPEQRTATVPEDTAILIPFDGIFSANPARDPARVAAINRTDLQGWTPFAFKLVVDGEEIQIDSSLTSPFLHETSVFSLPVPANAAARSQEAGFGSLPTVVYPFHSLEWIALLKPLPVGEHTLHVYGSDSVGTDHEWVTDVIWTINVVPRPFEQSVLATSATEFSGFRDAEGWSYGYRTVPTTSASENYDPTRDFIPFRGGPGQGSWNGQSQQWNGTAWKTMDGTELAAGSSRLAVPGLWTIRRWQASEMIEKRPVALQWTLAKGDATCGNGVTGALYINGQLADQATIPFDQTTVLTRTWHALLAPGDFVDLVLQPLGADGTEDLACDQALMTLSVSTVIPIYPRQPDNTIWLSTLSTPKLEVLSQSAANGRSALKWRSQASATYGIQVSSDLVNWTDVAKGLSGRPTVTDWSEPLASPGQPARFYRVVQETKSLDGLWVALHRGGYELSRIKVDGDEVVATRVIGGLGIPSGEGTLKANVKSGVAQIQVAGPGFVDPEWLPARFRITNPDQLTVNDTCSCGINLTFRRVD